MKLSIIIPCKNEEKNIKELNDKIKEELKDIKYEVIYVDDGSSDDSLNILKSLYEEDITHVKIISFSKNFKKDAALLAGLRSSCGEYTCIMDSNLKHDPSYIRKMFDILEEDRNCDIVAVKRQIHNNFIVSIINTIVNKSAHINMNKIWSSYRMFRKNVKDTLLNLSNTDRFTNTMFSWIGYNYRSIDDEVDNFNISEYLKCAIDAIKSYGNKPFSIVIHLGNICMLISIAYLIYLLINNSFNKINFIISLLFLLFSILFIVLGVIGNYLSHLKINIVSRPCYIVREKIGFSKETIL